MNIIEHVVKKCTSTGFSLLKTPYFIYLSNLCTHKGKPWKNVSIIENQDPINGWRILWAALSILNLCWIDIMMKAPMGSHNSPCLITFSIFPYALWEPIATLLQCYISRSSLFLRHYNAPNKKEHNEKIHTVKSICNSIILNFSFTQVRFLFIFFLAKKSVPHFHTFFTNCPTNDTNIFASSSLVIGGKHVKRRENNPNKS